MGVVIMKYWNRFQKLFFKRILAKSILVLKCRVFTQKMKLCVDNFLQVYRLYNMCCDHKILKRQHSETMAKYILAFKMPRFAQKLKQHSGSDSYAGCTICVLKMKRIFRNYFLGPIWLCLISAFKENFSSQSDKDGPLFWIFFIWLCFLGKVWLCFLGRL